MYEALKKHFSKEDRQIANKYLKRCSTSLEIREMKLKTIKRYHFTTNRMAILSVKKTHKWRITSVYKDGEKSEHSSIVDGNVKGCDPRGKQFVIPQEVKHRIDIWSINFTPG